MIIIRPNGLYSRSDLASMLTPAGVDVDHFIGRIKPRKVFKMLWSGKDILAALDTAPALAEHADRAEPVPPISPPGKAGRRGRRQAANLITLDEIS